MTSFRLVKRGFVRVARQSTDRPFRKPDDLLRCQLHLCGRVSRLAEDSRRDSGNHLATGSMRTGSSSAREPRARCLVELEPSPVVGPSIKRSEPCLVSDDDRGEEEQPLLAWVVHVSEQRMREDNSAAPAPFQALQLAWKYTFSDP